MYKTESLVSAQELLISGDWVFAGMYVERTMRESDGQHFVDETPYFILVRKEHVLDSRGTDR